MFYGGASARFQTRKEGSQRMSELILPKIVNAGIYDASTAHKNKTETRTRRVSLFELEIPMENGGVSHINDMEYPILADHVICGKPGHYVIPCFPSVAILYTC